MIDKRLDKLLDTSNTVKLYCAMLELVRLNYEHGVANRGLMKKVTALPISQTVSAKYGVVLLFCES